MKKPNFFIVGQAKAGTTALYSFLRQHPDIYMSDVKEPHFFCSDFHQQSDQYYQKKIFFKYRDINSYLKLFSKADSFKMVGEASIHYLYSKFAAQQIYNFNPEAKIIIMLREPIDWLYSLHNQFLNVNIEEEQDFVKALTLVQERKQGDNIPSRVICPSWLYYSDRIRYYEQVKRFYDVFEQSQIKVVIFDDWQDNNSKVYKDVLNFLEVNNKIEPIYKSINVRSTPRFKILNKIIYSPSIRKIAQDIIPYYLYEFITKKIIDKYLFKQVNKKFDSSMLNKEFKYGILIEIQQEIVEISNLLNIDLIEKWGYHNF